MNRIPTMISYEKDELTYSWLYRIAIKNKLKNVKELLNYYVYTYSAHKLQYDLKHIERLSEALCIDTSELLGIYLQTSTYPFDSLFLTSFQQTNYLNSVFRNLHSNKGIGFQNHTNINEHLYFCPVCKKEEIKQNGYFFFHRTHQLPGVKVCTKHNCILHQYTGRKGREFDINEPSVELTLKDKIDIELRYASFVNELLETCPDSNLDEINEIILNKLKSLDMSIDELPQYLEKQNLIKMITKFNYINFTRKSFRSKNKNFINDICVILMCLFESVSNIPFKKKEETIKFKQMIHKENYELISSYRDSIICLKHCDCNSTFICTGKAFEQGWRCPVCDLSYDIKTIIKRLITSIDDGSYEMIDEFKGLSTNIRFIHHKCGAEMITKPRELIYEGKRCNCSKTYTFEYVKKMVEIKKNYKLLDFNKNNNEIKVQNTYCNHSFSVQFNEFLEDRRCCICHPEPFNTRERFEKIMYKLVGDEYKLIGDFKYGNNHKIKILHKKCNQITVMKAASFIIGHRCKHCSKEIHPDKCAEFVNRASNGRYEFISQRKEKDVMLIRLKDNITHTEFEIHKLLALQELSRPSLSPVLSLTEKNKYLPPPSYKKDEVYYYIFSNYSKDELIHAKDIAKALSVDRTLVHRELKKMVNMDILVKVDKGIYQLKT